MTITLDGLPELERALAQKTSELRVAMTSLIAEEVSAIGTTARMVAPRKSGELRAGIRSEALGEEGSVRSTARHSTFVEHGTKGRRAQPFMMPAAEMARRRIPARAAAMLRRVLGG